MHWAAEHAAWPLAAEAAAPAQGITGEIYNIGTQKERTVMDVANDIAQIFGLPTNKITHVRDRAFNDRRYYICDDKLSRLGAPRLLAWSSLRQFCRATRMCQHGSRAHPIHAHSWQAGRGPGK